MLNQTSLWESREPGGVSIEYPSIGKAPSPEEEALNLEQKQLRPDQIFDLSELLLLLSVAQCSLPTWDHLLNVSTRLASPSSLQLLPSLVVRLRALAQQYKPTGPLLFTPFCAFLFRAGHCDLCGNSLVRDDRYRCTQCALAARLLLGYQSVEEWLQNGEMIG